jgi:hypothetical protein
MATLTEPVRLSGLKQAAFVMKCLTRGQRMGEITMAFGGDEQLVDMWILFLKHNHWMECSNGRWSLTPKGAMWSKNIADRTKVTTQKYLIHSTLVESL